MNYLNAFWVGGLICALCQVLIDKNSKERLEIEKERHF